MLIMLGGGNSTKKGITQGRRAENKHGRKGGEEQVLTRRDRTTF